MSIPYTSYAPSATPQTEPIPGESQVPNSAGGFSYAVDDWARLLRFLILGSEGGSYYASQQKLTHENATIVTKCLAADGVRAVNLIVEVSDSGRAPKNEPAIFALALAASAADPATRAYALAHLRKVCRIPTHLFHFVAYLKGMRGWGRGLRRAVSAWYASFTPDQLAYELVKYQSRDGWSNRDVLRKCHAAVPSELQSVIRWAVESQAPTPREDAFNAEGIGTRVVQVHMPTWTRGQAKPTDHRTYPIRKDRPAIIDALAAAKTATPTDLVQLIRTFGLTREMLPTEALNSLDVWAALLEKMPMTALVRNLGKMTHLGLLAPMADATTRVVTNLTNGDYLRKGRVHPLQILNALRVYGQGHGEKGKLTWTPVQAVVDALDAAFYASFGLVVPTHKRLLLALDVSGSMSTPIANTALSCREAAAAMALVTANVEPTYEIIGFTAASHGGRDGVSPLAISPRQRLDDVVRYLGRLEFGRTDCALPMLYAMKHNRDVDGILIYTDSETYAGTPHPSQALREYRRKQQKPQTAMVVVGMVSNGFTIADPKDPRMLDVVGFDLATPNVISEFVRG